MVVSIPVAYWNVQESMNLRLPVTIVTLWLILSIKTRSLIPPDFVLQITDDRFIPCWYQKDMGRRVQRESEL